MIRPREHPALERGASSAPSPDVASPSHTASRPHTATRGISFALMCALVVLAPIALRVLVMPVAPHDFWWHMAQGRAIVGLGRVPVVDSFSWTRAGQPFFDQSWLAQVFFYVLHVWGGVPLVVFAQTVCVVACYGMVLWLAVRRSGNARLAALLLLVGVVPMSLDNWQIRPQTFALPLFASTLLIVTAYRLRWFNLLPALPVLLALWVNMHGGFEQGLALLVVTLLGEVVRRALSSRTTAQAENNSPLTWRECGHLALWSALSFAATLLNPRGLHVYYYVHDVLRHPSTQFSGEWGRPTLGEFTGAWFWGMVALSLALLAWRRPKLPLTDWLLVAPFLLVALISGRSIMWFALVALPFLSLALSQPHMGATVPSEAPPTRAQSVMNGTLVALVWLPVLLLLPWWKASVGLPPPMGALLDPQTPVGAVNFLNYLPLARRPHRLYHSEGAGSYLCWALHQPKVWIDTRFELYPPQQWRDAIAFKNARDVDTLLAKYRFDAALLEARNAPLRKALQKRGWRVTFKDANTVLLQVGS